MRVYALRDEENELAGDLAYLECYDRPRSFFFELAPDADPWGLPFILHEFAQRGQHTIDALWSLRWVQSRLLPPERQNLGEVLRENNLYEYDELRLIELTRGRCCQDSCVLIPMMERQLPAWYAERVSRRMSDVFALSDYCLLATFRSGEALWCSAKELLGGRREFSGLLRSEEAFSRVSLQAGGHGVRWGERLMVSSGELREAGMPLPLSALDLLHIMRQALCTTSEAANLLGCTRQNISDLVRRGKLTPLKADGRTQAFLRADLLERR